MRSLVGEEGVEGFDKPDVREDFYKRACSRPDKAFALTAAVVTCSRPAQDHAINFTAWLSERQGGGGRHHEDPLLGKSYGKSMPV